MIPKLLNVSYDGIFFWILAPIVVFVAVEIAYIKIIYPFEKNINITFNSLHVWKYAKVKEVCSGPQIDPKFPIAVAGDFMEGPNVESAFISGEKAADLIFKRLH